MRIPSSVSSLLATLALLAACAGGGTPADVPVPETEALREELVRQDSLLALRFFEHRVRLFHVASRLRTANAELCGSSVGVGRFTGILGVPDSAAGAAGARLPGGTAPMRVLYVLPGSPAAEADVLPGDLVLGLDGAPVAQWGSRLEVAPEGGSTVALELLRGAEPRAARLEGMPACRMAAIVAWGQGLTARSNLVRVAVTTGLMRFVESDDELALVVGHEMAHRLLGHRASIPGRRDELEADRLGMYLAARAGYATQSAPAFLRRLAAAWVNTPEAPRGMRRRMAERAVAAAAVAREIADLQARREPLVPR